MFNEKNKSSKISNQKKKLITDKRGTINGIQNYYSGPTRLYKKPDMTDTKLKMWTPKKIHKERERKRGGSERSNTRSLVNRCTKYNIHKLNK